MSHHHDENVLSAVGDAAVRLDEKQRVIERRTKSRVRGLNHHAYCTTDAEKTRHFYEDILEMRMTIALRIPDEVFTGKPSPYCHFFFEMGDGSSIAFFDYPDFFDGKRPFEVPTVYHHHIAINVDSATSRLSTSARGSRRKAMRPRTSTMARSIRSIYAIRTG